MRGKVLTVQLGILPIAKNFSPNMASSWIGWGLIGYLKKTSLMVKMWWFSWWSMQWSIIIDHSLTEQDKSAKLTGKDYFNSQRLKELHNKLFLALNNILVSIVICRKFWQLMVVSGAVIRYYCQSPPPRNSTRFATFSTSKLPINWNSFWKTTQSRREWADGGSCAKWWSNFSWNNLQLKIILS